MAHSPHLLSSRTIGTYLDTISHELLTNLALYDQPLYEWSQAQTVYSLIGKTRLDRSRPEAGSRYWLVVKIDLSCG
jgi:hypothetical protein